jgi:flavin reductase (DIM6/NTAB) family NADH-FMN oxidoreductase RutF
VDNQIIGKNIPELFRLDYYGVATARLMLTLRDSTARNEMPQAGRSWKLFCMHKIVEPSILYFGTPVVLISTRNEDGTTNVAPMSSAWWLGWGCMIGLASSSKTPENLLREQECVLNLPSVAQADAVNRLAKTTGSNPVPASKLARGYRHVKDKLGIAGLTVLPSERVKAPRVAQCPVQMEAVLQARHPFGGFEAQRAYGDNLEKANVTAFELKIVRVHVEEDLLLAGKANHVNSDMWKPLIMNFAHFYGVADGRIVPSTLADIPEELYRPAQHMGDSRQEQIAAPPEAFANQPAAAPRLA